MDISLILTKYYPGRQWSMANNEYDTLVFHDDGIIPTLKELQEKDVIYQKEMADTEYLRLREKEYPSYEKKCDALWKRILNNDHTDSDILNENIEAINRKYPPPVSLV